MIEQNSLRLLDILWQLISSSKQGEAPKFVSAGHSLLITKQTGAGKSTEASGKLRKVAVVCSSGIACTVYGSGLASIVHSLYGLGTADLPSKLHGSGD